MPKQLKLTVSLSQSTKNWLFWARWLLIFIAIALGWFYSVDIVYWGILTLYTVQFSLLSYTNPNFSLRHQLAFGLTCDTLFMTWVLHFIDGVLSGLISILFLPALVGSLSSRRSLAWGLTALAILSYSLLMYLQLKQIHLGHLSHDNSDMSSHLLGMLTTFCVAVVTLTGFISHQANLLRRNQKKLVQLQEQQWREKQIVALATLSANTTHQIATPIASAKLLLEEWFEDHPNQAPSSLIEAKHQLERCQSVLQSQVIKSRQKDPNLIERVDLQLWLTQLCQDWWVGHNEVTFDYKINLENTYVNTDQNMMFSLLNLLDNAAIACSNEQEPTITLIAGMSGNQHASIHILDNGPGFTEKMNDSLGKQFIESENGLGIGIALAAAGIERMGGEVTLENTPSGSMITICLALTN
ncbi:HAMP domain-containing histidine kinase [Alteromonas sp. 5E99-2]|uniref:sensor histidine kinase n=1 Tax=Alteromonas sp. 5E99-2 TaxID=2817683 RepID=UPI001A99BFF8|nr:HAMP domain-containing sensor histidine kinase [Alteromonas sp. 5E99-2]MBO1256875.1 HAMP domain-containing histidine kinase [Alteromonas sp. 5E99-2]